MIIKPLVIDISHHNDVESFAQAKAAGVLGIIHKASQGRAMIDGQYARRRQAALAAGLLWGAYHFNTGEDPAAQVDHFFQAARPDEHTLMALDFEDNPGSNMSADQARRFLQIADAKLGRKLMIYGGNRVKELIPHKDAFFASHRLWLCQYAATYKLPAAWSECWLWQYAADGSGPKPHTVPGIPGNIDCNTTDRTPEQLAAEWAGEPLAPVTA